MTDEMRTEEQEGTDLGGFLKRIRKSRGLSLRDVERMTEGTVSNGYLSQLENGNIDKPSAMMLHRLAATYRLDYQDIMKRAGFLTEAEEPLNRVATSILGELTSDEEDQLLAFLGFLRSQKK
jgi:transcriptional regulator with XRE-family HTH domain